MSAIRTKEDLIDSIANERSWRVKEISQLKNLITNTSPNRMEKKVLCRAGIAFLYAHWEGFVKKSGAYYLEYVAMQRLTVSELKSNFITIILKKKLDQAGISKKYSAFDEFSTFLMTKQSARAKIPFKDIISTESNLSSTVLKEITWCLGIDYEAFRIKEKFIDSYLLGRRNHVAHGGDLSINENDFIELADEVIELITIFRNLIENDAVSEGYKRKPL